MSMKYSEKLDLSGKFTKFSTRKWEYLVVPLNKQLDNPSVTAYNLPPPGGELAVGQERPFWAVTQGRLGRMEKVRRRPAGGGNARPRCI